VTVVISSGDDRGMAITRTSEVRLLFMRAEEDKSVSLSLSEAEQLFEALRYVLSR